MVTRRQWFAAAASGIAVLAGWRYASSDERDGIVAVLRRRLDYLVLDDAGVHNFAADLAARGNIRGSKLRLVDAIRPIYERIPRSADASLRALQHGEERIVTLYLMSSDFFLNGADETRPVQYLGYYDPLDSVRPCSNPFWRPVSA